MKSLAGSATDCWMKLGEMLGLLASSKKTGFNGIQWDCGLGFDGIEWDRLPGCPLVT